MTYIDTHCHLVSEKLRDDLKSYVAEAKIHGIHKIINVAYDPETVELVQSQIDQHDMLYGAVGIQPHDALSFNETTAQRIKEVALNHKKIVAIGEIGLDAYYKLSPMENQFACFEHFLDLAIEAHLPVIVHVRETHTDVHSRLKTFSQKGGTGVIHCFTGSLPEAREFLDLGFYISFSGIVTFKSAAALAEVAKYVPSDKLLIETDSPYLAPIPMRGKTNQPSYVRHTCAFIAELRNMSLPDCAALTTQNAETLFPRLKN